MLTQPMRLSLVARPTLAVGLTVLVVACAERATAPVEAPLRTIEIPAGWVGGSSVSPPSYTIGLDSTTARTGAAAAYLSTQAPEPVGFGSIGQAVRADAYRGRRVRWAAWVRHTDLRSTGAGLWMRVDGPGVTQAFDNMVRRPLLGTMDWHEVAVVLDVPENALGLTAGVLLSGPGDLVVDDVRLEVVGSDVPSTDILSAPEPSGVDSATRAASYSRTPLQPVNLDFEGLRAPAATVAWLRATAEPLASVAPGTDPTDLDPLREMVGAAWIVGLGEGTHGTREFFQMKHRLVEFLVSSMGFTHFAIEATWPEANDVNHYVLTGEGDPAVLLSRLYFWTWNTQEVLDLILWMRRWNETAPADRRVRFLGFDMQFPGAAMDTVGAFVRRVDPSSATFVSDRYACVVPYRNHGRSFQNPSSDYAALPAETRGACRTALHQVFDFIREQEATFVGASSPAAYANALQSARVVQQFEELAASSSNASTASAIRDRAMAENVQWLLGQAGGDARMALWAHNFHVSSYPTSMGAHLRRAYGDGYLSLGFLFGHGSFNAVGAGGAGLRSWQTWVIPSGALEEVFLATQHARALFDARNVASGGAAAEPLRGPIRMRSIGAGFDAAREGAYFAPHLFPDDFDLLVFIASTTASTLLPFP